MAVLLFHGGFARFSGGYVGVDIFFVISGYLITHLILKEIDAETFSIARFYERRIRRIFPALFFTIALSVVGGALLLVPGSLKEMARSAIAVTLFVSNMLFWKESGYFDAPAAHKPLLHTWSLAVEEQFYILFPLLLMAIRRYGRSRFTLWLCLGFAGSLALGVYGVFHTPVAAFYLAPLRAWELILGAIVACGALPASIGWGPRNACACAGLMLVLYSVLGFDANTPFPGLAALVPTVGAALLVYAGTTGDTIVNRMLGTRPLVFVGLISYSLYLVHWPLIVFAKDFLIRDMSQRVSMALLLVAGGVAVLSWWFVERPFRSMTMRRSRIFAVALVVMMMSVSGEVFVETRWAASQRLDAGTADQSATTIGWRDPAACNTLRPGNDTGRCALGRSGQPTFLLWGDSHAKAFVPALGPVAFDHHAAGTVAFQNGCPPLLGIEVTWQKVTSDWASCATFNDDVLRYLARTPRVRTIVLASRWALFADGRPYKSEADSGVRLSSADADESADVGNAELFRLGLNRTVQTLLNLDRRVVLIGPVPEVGYEVPQALFIAQRTGRNVEAIIAPTREEFDTRQRIPRSVLNTFRGVKDVEIIEPTDILCVASKCKVTEAGRPLYQDSNHLSTYGSQHLSPLFDRLFLID